MSEIVELKNIITKYKKRIRTENTAFISDSGMKHYTIANLRSYSLFIGVWIMKLFWV